MKINTVIEKAKEKDRDDIFKLLKQVNMHFIPSKEMPCLTFENYFVAKAAGIVVGFCGYKIISDTEAKTELMVVDREFRTFGIGYKLQACRMRDAIEKGIKTLITNCDLPYTINWYINKFGYIKIGELKKFHEFGSPDIDFWTTLKVDLVEWNERVKEKENGHP